MSDTVSEFLKNELNKRSLKRKQYSLRAFARDMGVSASWLSRVMSGSRGISSLKASQLSKRLNISKSKEEYLVKLAESQFSRSQNTKKLAVKKLASLNHTHQEVEENQHSVFASWHSFAILSFIQAGVKRQDSKWFASKLGIPLEAAEASIQLLLKLNMIKRVNGSFKDTGHFFLDSPEAPNPYLRQFHTHLLQTAQEKLTTVPISERAIQSIILGVNPSKIDEAKIFIREFRDEFERKFCLEESNRTEVMALGIQYFPLSQLAKKGGD